MKTTYKDQEQNRILEISSSWPVFKRELTVSSGSGQSQVDAVAETESTASLKSEIAGRRSSLIADFAVPVVVVLCQ